MNEYAYRRAYVAGMSAVADYLEKLGPARYHPKLLTKCVEIGIVEAIAAYHKEMPKVVIDPSNWKGITSENRPEGSGLDQG